MAQGKKSMARKGIRFSTAAIRSAEVIIVSTFILFPGATMGSKKPWLRRSRDQA
jgi:hypothetical protein